MCTPLTKRSDWDLRLISLHSDIQRSTSSELGVLRQVYVVLFFKIETKFKWDNGDLTQYIVIYEFIV